MKNTVKVTGAVVVTLTSPRGTRTQEFKNMVVSGGKTFLAQWLAASSQSGPFMPYIAVGDDNTAVEAGDSALGNQTAAALGSVSSALNVLTVEATFGAGVATGDILEAGLFSADGGTMFSRALLVIEKGADEIATLQWNITFD